MGIKLMLGFLKISQKSTMAKLFFAVLFEPIPHLENLTSKGITSN